MRIKQIPPGKKGHPKVDQAVAAGPPAKPGELMVGHVDNKYRTKGKENQPHSSRNAMRSASAGKWRPITKSQTRSDSAITGLPPSPPETVAFQGAPGQIGEAAAWSDVQGASAAPMAPIYAAEFPGTAQYNSEQLVSLEEQAENEEIGDVLYHMSYRDAYAAAYLGEPSDTGNFQAAEILPEDLAATSTFSQPQPKLLMPYGLSWDLLLEGDATGEDVGISPGLVASLVETLEEQATSPMIEKVDLPAVQEVDEVVDTGLVDSLVQQFEEKSTIEDPETSTDKISIDLQDDVDSGVVASLVSQLEEKSHNSPPKSPVPQIALNQYGEEVFVQAAAPQRNVPVPKEPMYPSIMIGGKPGMDKKQGKYEHGHGKKERRPIYPPASLMVASHQRVEKKPADRVSRFYTRSASLTGMESLPDPLKLGLPHHGKGPKAIAAPRPDRVATVTKPRAYNTRSAAAAAAQADTMVVQSSPTLRMKPRARSPVKQPRGTKAQPAGAKNQPKHPPGVRHKHSHLAHEMASRGLVIGQQRLPKKRETTLPVALLGKSRLRYQHKLKGPVITRHQVRDKVRRYSMDSSALESMDEEMSVLGDDEAFAECSDPELCMPLVPPPEPELDPLHEDMVADILDVVGDPSVTTLFIVGGKYPAEYAMKPTLMGWSEDVEAWQELPGPPSVCSKGSAVAFYHGQLVITGGYKGPASTYFYATQDTTWTQGPKMETKRNGGHAMAVVADRLFVVGGYTSRCARMAEVEMFVSEEHCWSTCPPLVKAVAECEAAAMGNKLLVLGRSGYGADCLLIQTINPFTGVTALINSSPCPTFIPRYIGEDKGIFVFLHPNGTLYRFCEHQGEMQMDCSKKLEIFDERHDFGALLLHRKLVVIGGYFYEKKFDESRFWTKDVMMMDLKGKVVENCNIPQLTEQVCIWKLLRV